MVETTIDNEPDNGEVDKEVEYYWSDWSDDDDDDDDQTAEVMTSLMTTQRQDLSTIISRAEAERLRQEMLHNLCPACKNIVKYFPVQETDIDILTETDSDYVDRRSDDRHDTYVRREMSDTHRGKQNAIFPHGAKGEHFCYQLGPKNQTPTVKVDFSTHPKSRASFSIHSCPDTGATISIIKASIAKDKKLKLLASGISNLRYAQGIFMKVDGKVRVYVSIRGGGRIVG